MLSSCWNRSNITFTHTCSEIKQCFKDILAGLMYSKDICTKCLCEKSIIKEMEEMNPLIDERFNPVNYKPKHTEAFIVESPGC